MDGNVVACDLKTIRQLQARSASLSGKINIENVAALIAVKMAMFAHVRAIPHCRAIQIDLIDQVALDEEIEAIINSRHRDLRHGLFRPHENLLGSRVIALVEQHAIDLLALRRKAKAPCSQSFADGCLQILFQTRHKFNLGSNRQQINIWNNSNS